MELLTLHSSDLQKFKWVRDLPKGESITSIEASTTASRPVHRRGL